MDDTEDQVGEKVIGGHPFKTTFSPASSMSPQEIEERMAEMKRRAGLPRDALVPPRGACDEQIARLDSGIIVGRSRAYVPYERDSNCDFSGGSAKYPLALIIDGTGHDKGGEAAKHTENGKRILDELEKCIDERLINSSTPQQVSEQVLALLRVIDSPESSTIHHISCTLSTALKVAKGKKTYVLTFHWGDNVILVINPTNRSVSTINAPLNSDYGIGATHSVSSKNKGGALPYSVSVHELQPGDYVVGLTDGVWDHLVSDQASKSEEGPRFHEGLLIDIFSEITEQNYDNPFREAERLFEEARRIARMKVEDGKMKEAELDDMSVFIFPPETPALRLDQGEKDATNKGCVLA